MLSYEIKGGAVFYCPGIRYFALVMLTLFTNAQARGEEQFNLNALSQDSPLADSAVLKKYISDNELLAGNYLSSVYFNLNYAGKKEITYQLSADKNHLFPVLTKADLRSYGVNVDAIPTFDKLADDDTISDISQYIKDATYRWSDKTQRLDIRVPQIALTHEAKDLVSPELWDDGLPAFLLGYYYSGSQSRYRNGLQANMSSNFLNLNTGANYGGWRVRNNASYSDGDWENLSSTLSHDIKKLRSQFLLGDSTTPADLFDGIPFRGVRIYSDNDMLPYSQQGFAPVIRGIAQSDARVTIKQHGYTLYETYVPPGPFEITDITQISSGSDFDITVTEADGSEHSFTQSSASLPVMLRRGGFNYSLALGRYQSKDVSASPDFGQAQLVYGLPWGITAYGGSVASQGYYSSMLGLGADLHTLGSVSFDSTHATSIIDGATNKGMSYRIQYAKNIDKTGTNLTLASYRYSSKNFYTFSEAIDQQTTSDTQDDMYAYRNAYNRRSRAQININQSLGSWGNVYISAYQQDYWQLNKYERNISLGYNMMWHRISFAFNASQTEMPTSQRDNQFSFNVSVPLDKWLPQTWANYSLSQSQQGNATHQTGISGNALTDNKLSYAVQQSWDEQNKATNGSLNATYRSSSGSVSGGYHYSNTNQQINYSAQGGVVVHPYGVTLAQSLPDTMTLVRAPGASGVKINNGTGIYTDSRGYAIVPYSNPYRQNTISLNTAGQRNIDISDPVNVVIPSRGAVALADYKVRTGARVLFTLRHHNQPVPFGALVSLPNEKESPSSLVDDRGQVYITGVSAGMKLVAQWGNSIDQTCETEALPFAAVSTADIPVIQQTLECR